MHKDGVDQGVKAIGCVGREMTIFDLVDDALEHGVGIIEAVSKREE